MVEGPVRKVPVGIAEDRLLGGLDLAATLAAGAPRMQRGVLAEADGGVVVIAMAERATAGTAARVSQALDVGAVGGDTARFGIVVLDEGIGEEERAAACLLDRAAIHLELEALERIEVVDLSEARELLPMVVAGDEAVEALCAASLALGVGSGRAPLHAVRVARAAAALEGRLAVEAADVSLAARLVLSPRATQIPAEAPPGQPAEQPPPEPPQDSEADGGEKDQPDDRTDEQEAGEALADQVLEAARAAIPAGLLALLQQKPGRVRGGVAGKSGAAVRGARGRPVNTRAGVPRDGLRLNLVETLRAAAPWQKVREGVGVKIRRDDLRVTRREQRAETVTIFLVDASGSSALNRLAEAKGAVELLLADCYVRRDQVAVLAFRGTKAEVLLPPTRSLVRAKRSLAGLPGGGGTPLAAGIEGGALLADGVRRRGGTPTLVLLTDGQANVGRDGKGGRARAQADALVAARAVRAAGHAALMIDTSTRPNPAARALADAMGGRYLALPQADAGSVSRVVRGLV
jgi:magnesium chelatase subunit D